VVNDLRTLPGRSTGTLYLYVPGIPTGTYYGTYVQVPGRSTNIVPGTRYRYAVAVVAVCGRCTDMIRKSVSLVNVPGTTYTCTYLYYYSIPGTVPGTVIDSYKDTRSTGLPSLPPLLFLQMKQSKRIGVETYVPQLYIDNRNRQILSTYY
jgi:hypothetical protein